MADLQRTIISDSNTLALAEVIARLGRHEAVDGVILIGSTGAESLTPASDFDLIVILSAMPVPLHVGLTWIEGRLADVIFFAAAAIDRILDHDALRDDIDGMDGKLIRWLQAGQIVVDRSGRLQRARQKVQTGEWLKETSDEAIYGTWFGINYNVLQTRRMMASSDPTYQMAVDLRLLYTLADLWLHYFRLRRLPWEGEKGSIRYLAAHDPAYLELFQQCLAEADRPRKVQLYEQLAALTLAPVGGLWADGATAIQFDLKPGAELTPAMVTGALAFWQKLVAGESDL